MAAIGVHLGASCACAAVYKDGRADVVANDAGDRVTPAVVAFSESEEVVGLAAKQSRIRNVSSTVVKVKQILGRSSGDPQAEKYIAESKCSVIEKNGKLQYEIDNKLITPEDVAKLIFSKMKETAQSALGSDVNDVVITVPFDFGENQKNALGSCKHDIRGNPRAMMKLMNSADIAKHSLSTLGSANCFVDSLYDGLDFDCNVSRARFELICSSLFSKCVEAIKKLLQQVGFTADDINKVVLCGGSARIPKLQQLIKDIFPTVELLNSIPPDEVIPIGAAIEAGILLGKENPLLEEEALIECSAKDILLKGVDESGADKFTVLFPSGTPLPARRQHTLHAPGNTSSVCLELYESLGKSPMSEEGKFAQIVLQDLDKKEDGLHDILTVLTMKRDGSLHVTCTDQDTGKCEIITVEVAS
ncbi:heat shock 70 kDa protein 14 isoform X2 [Strigops habroptila]|uniref:heat shock 70 kDa protein 14 isoform X2 n=1 Tax=Strigops habroptila TaxID=2489341 RepID=UPI0011CFF537|nr:heat shock 70 kDa protein 14 isoform X2 [Strigops habroptila]